MIDTNIPFYNLLKDGFDRADEKRWSVKNDGQPVAREAAVKIVANILKKQMIAPIHTTGQGTDFAIGLFCFGEYFSSIPPSEAELTDVLGVSEFDYYADLAVKLLLVISRKHPISALNDWEQRRYLGQTSAPDKPPGPGRYKNLHRDKLIVSQIRELQNVGFKPTRNEATLGANSGCDIVVDALKNNSLAFSYAAIEAIWKKAENMPNLSEIAALFTEAILAQSSNMPPE